MNGKKIGKKIGVNGKIYQLQLKKVKLNKKMNHFHLTIDKNEIIGEMVLLKEEKVNYQACVKTTKKIIKT